MDGFKVVNTRTVTQAGEDPRVLRLTSVYRPSRNVVLVGTGGKPAGPSQVIPNRPTSGGAQAAPATAATPAPASGTPATKPSSSGPTPAPKPSTNQTAPATKPSTAPAVPAAPAPATKPVISPLFPGSAPKPGGR